MSKQQTQNISSISRFFEQIEFTLDLTIFKKIKSGKTKSVKIANVIYDFDFPIFFTNYIRTNFSSKKYGKRKRKSAKTQNITSISGRIKTELASWRKFVK